MTIINFDCYTELNFNMTTVFIENHNYRYSLSYKIRLNNIFPYIKCYTFGLKKLSLRN